MENTNAKRTTRVGKYLKKLIKNCAELQEIYRDLPDFSKIATHPDKAKISPNKQAQYVVVARIINAVQAAEPKKQAALWEQYWIYLKRLDTEELRMMAGDTLCQSCPAILRTNAWKEFAKEFAFVAGIR